MRKAIVRVVLIALLSVSASFAQPGDISPQAIVVNPAPSFDVDVWLDRAPDRNGLPTYRVGEPIRVGVRVSEGNYVYLFSVSSSGEVVQILPNRFSDGRDAFLPAGETRYFPPDRADYTFAVDAPGGLAKVVAVASRDPLDTRSLASFNNERDLLATSQLGDEGFARALSIVVRPLPQKDWATATAQFQVVTGRTDRAPRQKAPVDPLNPYLDLMPYPGSVVTSQSSGRKDSESTFSSNARLHDVYEHFHQQLVRAGWRRTEIDRDKDEVEAEYRRKSMEFELELESKGRNRYTLEIDFD